MLQQLKTRIANGLRREPAPVIPERGPATFLVEPSNGDLEATVEIYREAFDASDDVRLVGVGRAPTGLASGDGPPVEAVADASELRERAFTEQPATVGAFRRLYARHRELDELLARLPALREGLRRAAGGHPRAREVDALLDVFVDGYGTYARTGQTPLRANTAMRQLFVITNGTLNRALQEIHRVVYPPAPIAEPRGLLADIDEGEIRAALENIERDGLHVFSERVPDELLDRLEAFARQTPLLPHPGGKEEVLYDEDNPVATAYYLQPPRVLSDPAGRELYTDTSLLAMAQRVLGCQPVLSHLGSWWSTCFGGKAVSEVAQLYHFDMDRPAFVQFFIYLTDVDENNGPHCFVRRSHRERPMPLRRDGRIPDEEIREHYTKDDVLEIYGQRGTIFAVETTAFHKGKPLTQGHRLVFQWIYATNLFGAEHAELPVPDDVDQGFLDTVRHYPHTFERASSSKHDLDAPAIGRWAATPS